MNCFETLLSISTSPLHPGIDTKPFVDGPPGSIEKGMEVRAIPTTASEAAETGLGGIVPEDIFAGRLEFRGVKFAYPQREAAILGGLDLVVAPGETVALIGQSGSG